ncbi:hypothetical protein EHM92_04810 [bacterium]|nr:MAG: hypothetical protein EHM92_04810 [bacterium]
MFIGHFGVAFGSKRIVPTVSLGTLILAAQLLDLVWPILLLLGVEHVRIDPGNTAFTPLEFYDYPITHSLLLVLVWSLLFAGVYYGIRRGWKGAIVAGCAVLSHWVLDFITHRPDLPLFPWGQSYAGLGLWNSIPATIIVEWAIFIAGVALYATATSPLDRIGRYAFWGLVAFLVLSAIAAMGSVPPDAKVVAVTSLLLWLLVPWGYWIDRHRRPVSRLQENLTKA